MSSPITRQRTWSSVSPTAHRRVSSSRGLPPPARKSSGLPIGLAAAGLPARKAPSMLASGDHSLPGVGSGRHCLGLQSLSSSKSAGDPSPVPLPPDSPPDSAPQYSPPPPRIRTVTAPSAPARRNSGVSPPAAQAIRASIGSSRIGTARRISQNAVNALPDQAHLFPSLSRLHRLSYHGGGVSVMR